jgi:hypothetical protein
MAPWGWWRPQGGRWGTPQKKCLSIIDMGLPVINYERLNRLNQADVPIPSRWDMTWATKACLGMILIGLLILFKRRINKNDRNAHAQAKANIF